MTKTRLLKTNTFNEQNKEFKDTFRDENKDKS